jgi:hypothetical protein
MQQIQARFVEPPRRGRAKSVEGMRCGGVVEWKLRKLVFGGEEVWNVGWGYGWCLS